MWKDAIWLGVPREEIAEKQILQGDMNGRFAYYRLSFTAEQAAKLTADISANSRYRLWVNEEPVLSGPCRSSRFRHFYETVELGHYLKPGKNVLAVQVLLCDSMYCTGGPDDRRAPLNSVETLPVGHRLVVEGSVADAAGREIASVTTGKADWRVWLDNSFYLTREEVNSNMGAITEQIDFRDTLPDWKKADFDDSAWRAGEPLEPAAEGFEKNFGLLKSLRLEQRPIPLPYEKPDVLTHELGESISGDQTFLTLAPGESRTLLFDGETLFNAYFCYHFAGGRGARVTFGYFERFAGEAVKRDDDIGGTPGQGVQQDEIVLPGGEFVYEPFWYRTMRFLKIEIRAAEEPVCFYLPQVRRTGYPLQPEAAVRSDSAPWVEQVYRMCERTLQNCMMESYMDCPFWEQMQYPMDTRLQALFTYVCSTDTRLAKKALQDFHDSMEPCGLIRGRAPGSPFQIISTFSLYYIFMLLEYYRRTGETEVLKLYRADADRILEYYDRHIGESGLVEKLGYWEFVDWQEAWKECFGVPAAAGKGPSTIINLMYGRALLAAAEISEATGRAGLAQEYRKRQQAIVERVRALCWDADRGLYREGPDYPEYTQHAQSWAVLNGMLSDRDAREVMERCFTQEDVLKCSFSTAYELFRACERAGCYELAEGQLDMWIRLLGEHCTTCPETPAGDSRSECHGWSALPMYELLAVMAGIRRESADPALVTIRPHLCGLADLEGAMPTEFGRLSFAYTKQEKGFCGRLTLPEGMRGSVETPEGSCPLHAGENTVYFA